MKVFLAAQKIWDVVFGCWSSDFGTQESRRRGRLLHVLGRFSVLFLRTLNTAGSSVAGRSRALRIEVLHTSRLLLALLYDPKGSHLNNGEKGTLRDKCLVLALSVKNDR